MWRRLSAGAFLIALAASRSVFAATTVTLFHFSDYHSHALPFYSEGQPDQGGIARAIAYLRQQHQRGAIVLSGGDMVNKGSPAWSDKYQCVEWPWFNGIVDAMAYGNHDADYGGYAFQKCAKSVEYPIVSANVVDGKGHNVFTPYVILLRGKLRIGVFAIAGPDFDALVKPDARPSSEVKFADRVAAAREAVRTMRKQDKVNAVVMIGHEHHDDDFALAKEVPGIDVIFGTHSHRKDDLQLIPGTKTWFISPFQYLAYVSRLVLTFDKGKLTKVAGGLVAVNASMPQDATIAKRVAQLESELERDPAYASLFAPVGSIPQPLDVPQIGHAVVSMMQRITSADVAISTTSSFRQGLPAGTVTMEALRSAMPYDNEIVTAELSGEALRKLFVVAGSGADGGAFLAGAQAPDPARRYKVATTDYLARVAAGYRDAFAGAVIQPTGLRVRDEFRKMLAARP